MRMRSAAGGSLSKNVCFDIRGGRGRAEPESGRAPARAAAAALVLAALLARLPAAARAEDWPTYRHDPGRAGATADSLALPLQECWMHRAARPPAPAWPAPAPDDVLHEVRNLARTLDFDSAFHPVVARGLLLYGSSSEDSVIALDAASGARRWSFQAEGPVRLAPAVAGDAVYAGSDDGCLYALDAQSGALRWKTRVGPVDRRLPGNGRMISLWPVRGGLVVDGGTVYATAGVFPEYEVYLCALDARDGREMWKQKIPISAQGPLVASAAHLFSPAARVSWQAFDRATGNALGELAARDYRSGGCFGMLLEDTLALGGGERRNGLTFCDAAQRTRRLAQPGERAAATLSVIGILKTDALVALDRAALIQERKAVVKWEVPCTGACEIIAAGDAFVVGREGEVTVLAATNGNLLGSAKVAGRAYGLAAAGGRLYVSTDEGAIHGFGPGAEPAAAPAAAPPAPAMDPDFGALCVAAAEAALAATDVRRGYCLVADAGTGRLALEIARRSELQVIGVEPDPAKAAAARALLVEAGLYGTRATIHAVKTDALPYPPYFANLVVSEAVLRGEAEGVPAPELMRVLRPGGGVAVFCAPAVAKFAAARPGWNVRREGALLVSSCRREPLKGAGEWSHLYGDAGNTACSGDGLARGTFDLLWFGDPGPGRMVDRHNRSVAPLFQGGRLFVSGMNYLTAADGYNGTILWEREIPDSVRMSVGKNCGNMAAADGLLYVTSGRRCLALDAQTGADKAAFEIPASADAPTQEWAYVALADRVLLGSASRPDATWKTVSKDSWSRGYLDFRPVVCSDSLFAFERESGRRLWAHVPERGVLANPSIAAGEGRVVFVESENPETRGVASGRVPLADLLGKGCALVALDVQTGKTLWRKPAPDLAALQNNLYVQCAGERVLVSGSRNLPAPKGEGTHYELRAFDARTGDPLWQATSPIAAGAGGSHGEQDHHPVIVSNTVYVSAFAYDLRTGAPVADWKWDRGGHGCGTLSGSLAGLFYRGYQPRMMDLKTRAQSQLTTVTRPGCWINIVPAGGLVLIPEGSSGCTCAYGLQTSLALVPRP